MGGLRPGEEKIYKKKGMGELGVLGVKKGKGRGKTSVEDA